MREPAPYNAREERAPTRVLLVDDHEMFIESLKRVLAEEPTVEVVGAAGTVAEAAAIADAVAVDVAVVDYVLPDGDGVALAQRWANEHPDIKVLMLTGSANEGLVLRAIEAGCSGFVTKDRAIAELLQAIRALAAGDAWMRPDLMSQLLPRLRRTGDSGRELTPREIDVLRLAAEGWTNAAVAEALFVSVHTVRNHMQSAMTKLGAHSKLEAVVIAVRRGIITFPTT